MKAQQGFAFACGASNLGGLALLGYVPLVGVDHIDRVAIGHNFQPSIILKPEYSSLSAKLKMHPKSWKHKTRDGKHGIYYQINVTDRLLKYDDVVAEERYATHQPTYILCIIDKNGKVCILGDTDNGAIFIERGASGDRSRSMNKVQIQWTLKTHIRA